MKRSRSQVSREMSPGANEEGFPSRVENEEMVGVEELHGLGRDNGDNHVTVVGAGPAGLMLAFVYKMRMLVSLLTSKVQIS